MPKIRGETSADNIRIIEWRTEISNLKTICLHLLRKIFNKTQIIIKSLSQSIPNSFKMSLEWMSASFL